jgi:hypothetical protein
MVVRSSIGCFNSVHVTFLTFRFFHLSTMPSPPPCYIIGCAPFDARTHLGSKSTILIQGFVFPQHHYMGGCSTVASMNGPD